MQTIPSRSSGETVLPSCRHNRLAILVEPESHTGKNGGMAMALVLEINFALWVMIGCLAREAFQFAM